MSTPPIPPDRKVQTSRFIHAAFMVMALAGAALFHFYRLQLVGGLGLGMSLFGLASWFHFRRHEVGKTQSMDTKMSWFLLGCIMLGVLILLVNLAMKGTDFHTGIAAALVFVSALTYCMELLLTWYAHVR